MAMTPEDVRDGLTHAGREKGAMADGPPSAAPPVAAKTNAILASISASYFKLRRGLAAAAFLFPILLWIAAGFNWQHSISAYYHSGEVTRTVFVGVLWAIGSFLFFYKGYAKAEDHVLDLAGAAAIAVSLFPMDWPEGSVRTTTGALHYASAAVFFMCIAYVCVFRSSDTLRIMTDPVARERFRMTYRVLGALMIGLPILIAAIFLAVTSWRDTAAVLLTEIAGIYVFATFWLVKSREISILERQ
jgi:hypothetical protein